MLGFFRKERERQTTGRVVLTRQNNRLEREKEGAQQKRDQMNASSGMAWKSEKKAVFQQTTIKISGGKVPEVTFDQNPASESKG